MSFLAPSRIPRSPLLCSLTIVLLAPPAHAAAPTAMAISTPWDKIELIVGIIAGIMAIIGGIAGFIFWLKKTIKDWIDDAVGKGVEKCQEALRKQKRDIDRVLLETNWKLPPAGPAQERQRSEAARKASLDFISPP